MNRFFDFVRQIYAGKTIGRILLNWEIVALREKVRGKVVDLAGGLEASYYRYLPANISVTRTNYHPGSSIDQVIDLNTRLPFEDNSFDTVLFFNAIYILDDHEATLREIRRILRPHGTLLLSSPFLYNEMPEPHDYMRFTSEGLSRVLASTGFVSVSIHRFGERITAAANLLHPLFYFNTVRFVVYSIALFLDRVIPRSLARRYPSPIGYVCVARP